jgi:hypothetical protein
MLAVSLSDIHSDRELDFDLYLHMPANSKFILYGRKGNLFSVQQKARLQNRGVVAVHLFETQVPALQRYSLQAFMDQKITQHHQDILERNSSPV